MDRGQQARTELCEAFRAFGFQTEDRREHGGSAPARGALAERRSEDRILTYTLLREQLFW